MPFDPPSWELYKNAFLEGQGTLRNGTVRERIGYPGSLKTKELRYNIWYYILENEHLKEGLTDYY